MRFIFNFIFFGILFYLIYLFFPEAFTTLVGWANKTYEFLKEVFIQVSDKFHQTGKSLGGEGPHPSQPQPTQALMALLPLYLMIRSKI